MDPPDADARVHNTDSQAHRCDGTGRLVRAPHEAVPPRLPAARTAAGPPPGPPAAAPPAGPRCPRLANGGSLSRAKADRATPTSALGARRQRRVEARFRQPDRPPDCQTVCLRKTVADLVRVLRSRLLCPQRETRCSRCGHQMGPGDPRSVRARGGGPQARWPAGVRSWSCSRRLFRGFAGNGIWPSQHRCAPLLRHLDTLLTATGQPDRSAVRGELKKVRTRHRTARRQ
jgi:hypothetical protein